MEGGDNLMPLGQLSHSLEDFMGLLLKIPTTVKHIHYTEDYF